MFEQNLRLENISMVFNSKFIIKELNFQFKGPGLVIVQGANGTGKTTLLKIISGLLIPTQGTCQLNHKLSYEEGSKNVTSLFALSNGLMSEWNGKAHLEWVEAINGGHSKQMSERFLKDFCFASDVRHKKTSEYSSSMGQILKLAMAFHQKRPFLILDEPFIYLSNKNKDILINKILDASFERTVIISQQDLMNELAHKAMIIEVGKR